MKIVKSAMFFGFTLGLTWVLSCDNNSNDEKKDDIINKPTKNGVLMAHYPLDGNADDISGFQSDGIVSGAISTMDRHNQEAKAMYFDGNTNFISVADTTNFQFDDSLTVMAWVRTDSLKSQIIVRKGGSLVIPVFELYLSGIGNIGFRLGPHVVEKSGGYPLQTWMHITGTYDTQNMILYYNGSPVDTLSVDSTLVNDKNPLLIGTRTAQNSNTFAGRLDEIKIYSRTLSANEIAAMAIE